MATTNDSLKCVEFNVSGTIYEVETDVLSKYPESKLTQLYASQSECRELEVDYPAKQFERIIKYMRDKSLDLKELSPEEVKELSQDADYFQLSQLVGLCEEDLKKRDNLRRDVLRDLQF